MTTGIAEWIVNMRRLGFTLIEMLLVISIIGIMATVSVISLGGLSVSQFLANADAIANICADLTAEAIFSSTVISCTILDSGKLSCQKLIHDSWQPLDLNKFAFNWPADLRVIQVRNSASHNAHTIVFLPYYSSQNMSIKIGQANFTAWLDGDLLGRYNVAL
jgi:prepilin-type N-terminal cleavage/methylation domain-containing protein